MSWTKQEVDALAAEFRKDLAVFTSALDTIQRRRFEVEGTGHEEYFSKSSGVTALTHLLIMVMSSTEGIIEDLKKNRDGLPDERPRLKLVQDEVKDATD
jgi:hypothetical protein